jgi:hypothetical protein
MALAKVGHCFTFGGESDEPIRRMHTALRLVGCPTIQEPPLSSLQLYDSESYLVVMSLNLSLSEPDPNGGGRPKAESREPVSAIPRMLAAALYLQPI